MILVTFVVTLFEPLFFPLYFSISNYSIESTLLYGVIFMLQHISSASGNIDVVASLALFLLQWGLTYVFIVVIYEIISKIYSGIKTISSR